MAPKLRLVDSTKRVTRPDAAAITELSLSAAREMLPSSVQNRPVDWCGVAHFSRTPGSALMRSAVDLFVENI
ncbi:hypothetical protein [Variovorax sp. V116]|uniref:hypothetical protein n=1 Tax=Variovorax sp. V116 TaxID=3065953 RepID=UPI0034E8FEE3